MYRWVVIINLKIVYQVLAPVLINQETIIKVLKKQLALEDASLLEGQTPRKEIINKIIVLALLLAKQDVVLVQLTADLLLLVTLIVVKGAAMDVLIVVVDVQISALAAKEAAMEAVKELVLLLVQNSAQALVLLDVLDIATMDVLVKK